MKKKAVWGMFLAAAVAGAAENYDLNNLSAWENNAAASEKNGVITVVGKTELKMKEFIDVDPDKNYRFSVSFRIANNKAASFLPLLMQYDASGRPIYISNTRPIENTFTELAAPARRGQTEIFVKDASKWEKGKVVALAFDAKEDYSDLPNYNLLWATVKDAVREGDSWKVTMDKPVAATFPAGTMLRQHHNGGGVYPMGGRNATSGWQTASGSVRGMETQTISARKWAPGAVRAKLFLMVNWNNNDAVAEIKDVSLVVSAGNGASVAVSSPLMVHSGGSEAELRKSEFDDGKTLFVSKSNALGVSTVFFPTFEARPGEQYRITAGIDGVRLNFGCRIALDASAFDSDGQLLKRFGELNSRFHSMFLVGAETHKQIIVKCPPRTAIIRPELSLAGNPAEIAVNFLRQEIYQQQKPFAGIYSPPDPPAEREETMAALKRLNPAEARIEKRAGGTVLLVDGKPFPYTTYKGFSDYSKFGEAGADLVITRNDTRLYFNTPWDKAIHLGNGKFDFTRLENKLMAIHAANPRARVIVEVSCDADNEWLERNPDSIFLGEDGRRGIRGNSGFNGFGDKVDESAQKYWAQTYASIEYQDYIRIGLREMAKFLRETPAGNIVVGFKLFGGHDGQFIPWRRRDGDMDYSESFQRGLRNWLREKYGDDRQLRRAWGDDKVTLENARVFSAAEYRIRRQFSGAPGLDRKIADCREFLSVSTARCLRAFARELKENFGRPCVVQTWYSSAIWRQTSRLSLDELAEGGYIDIVGMVSDYAPPRLPGQPGGSANFCIAAANLRGVLFVQELDHRTWRSQSLSAWNYIAEARTPEEFRHQIMRDVGSVLASGGSGFYFYDMFGSWYNDPEALETVRIATNMAKWALQNGQTLPRTQTAIFLDEKEKFHCNDLGGDNPRAAWRLSGLTPDIYMLDDLCNDNLPDYRLYIISSPLTLTRAQLEALKRKAARPGNVILIAGGAGYGSPDFSGSAEVMAAIGMKVTDQEGAVAEGVVAATDSSDPLLKGIHGYIGNTDAEIHHDQFRFREQPYWSSVSDPQAVILGRWSGSGLPALAVKRDKNNGTLIYCAKVGALSPRLLANAAAEAGIVPPSAPGNVTYVGHGVAAVHRLKNEAVITFQEDMEFFDPATGKPSGSGRKFDFKCAPGESGAVLYRRKTSSAGIAAGACPM